MVHGVEMLGFLVSQHAVSPSRSRRPQEVLQARAQAYVCNAGRLPPASFSCFVPVQTRSAHQRPTVGCHRHQKLPLCCPSQKVPALLPRNTLGPPQSYQTAALQSHIRHFAPDPHHVQVRADDREGQSQAEEQSSSIWPSWLSKDDVITVALALGISYGVRWQAKH